MSTTGDGQIEDREPAIKTGFFEKTRFLHAHMKISFTLENKRDAKGRRNDCDF
jgi:hypothetical protein